MAGGFSSKWTTMGNNNNSTVDSGVADGGDPLGIGTLSDGLSNVTSGGGTNNRVRHECTMWLVDTSDTWTPTMDWAINNDFTIVINGTGQTLDGDPGSVGVYVEGSVDGENFKEMKDTGDWVAGTTGIGHLVYDFETYGRMPYMRLRLNGGAVDNGARTFKINVFMHNI